MNSTEPPDDLNDAGMTPTILEGGTLEDLRKEISPSDLTLAREFLGRGHAETTRNGDDRPTLLESLGPFRDLVEIGRGGMGVVYRARDPETGAEVAVKVPTPELMPTPATRRLFDKEAAAVSRLDHPAIVRHRPLAVDGSRFFIVSEYCNGPDLERWLRVRKRPVPAREAARIIRALADAVAHAHSRGVLHRDVKPSNILLPGATETSAPEEISPRLTDFGLAKLLDTGEAPIQTATATGIIMGSPPYMAPEQAAGRRGRIDQRTDVYGLGAVLYELLTTRPPFRGETPIETLGMVISDDPVPVRVLRPKTPRGLETIVHQCLEKSRERRYDSAEALRDDLDAFLSGGRLRARRPGPILRCRRWLRRRPRSAALAVTALAVSLILAAGAAAWTVALSRGRDRTEQFAYASRILLAQRAQDDGQLVRSQPILAGLIPEKGERDRREFAWRYLWHLSRREARMILDPGLAIDHATLSPNESWLAYGGDNEIGIHDLRRKARLWRATMPGMYVYEEPVFSSDGSRVGLLSITSEEQTEQRRAIEIRNAADGTLLGRRLIPSANHVFTIGFASDGRIRVLAAVPTPESGETVELQTWADHGPLADAAPPTRLPVLLGYAKSAASVMTVDRRGLPVLLDPATGSTIGLEDENAPTVRSVFYSEDGRRVAVVRSPTEPGLIHDVRDGRTIGRFPPIASWVTAIAFQPGGEALLVRTDTQEVRLIDATRRLDVRVFEPSSEPGVGSNRLRFSPDGLVFLVHRSQFLGSDHIEVRSTEDGRRLGETPARYKGLVGPWVIRDGARPELIYALGPHAWRWEWSRSITPGPSNLLQAHTDETWAVVYSADGSLLATSANNERDSATIRLRSPDGRVIREWADMDSTAADLAFAPDASWIATAHLAESRALRIRPTRGDGEVVSVELPDGEWARAVDADPSRPLVHVGGDRGTILAWDVEHRRELWRVMPPPELRKPKTHERIHDLVIAPDGRRLIVVNDRGLVRSLDARDGSLLATHETRSPMLAAAYSPDGATVAAGDQEGRIHLLDATTLSPIQVILGDDCDLRTLAFSPDGRTLAAAGLGRVVRLWDPLTGEELLSLAGHEAQINAVAFSPDGETLASADHVGIVRFWRAPRRPEP